MDLGVVLGTVGLVVLAEIPDKTMIATLVMGARGRPVAVWAGAGAAFVVQAAIAVVAGRLLLLAPHRVLEGIVTALFAAGAVYLLVVPERRAVAEGREEAAGLDRTSTRRVATTAFVVIFVGEFGDLTQILVVNLTAHTHQPASVFVGAAVGLVAVAAAAAWGGRLLLRVLPVTVIRRVGGLVFLGFAAYGIYSLVSG